MLGCISVHDACVDISLQNQIKLTNMNPKSLKVKNCCLQHVNLIIYEYINADNTYKVFTNSLLTRVSK